MGRQPRAKPDLSLLQGVRAYSSYRSEPAQNPPQSVSGIFPWVSDGRVTARQVSDALTSIFVHAAPEPSSDESGARDCLVWYDAL